jgi:Flp pilus assembly protein TadG
VAVVGTLVGFLIFMVLLLFSAQVLIHLYATSALTSAATRAAETVAQAPSPDAEVGPAEEAARSQLGPFGATRTSFTWLEVDAQQVVLKVTGRTPGFVTFVPGWQTITRTVTVRTERFR